MRLCNKILLASTNKHKFDEFRALLSAYPGVALIPAESVLKNAEQLSKAESFNTYQENAAIKARLANQGSHYPALGDDTGIEVDALGGMPGVRSHRYAVPKIGQSQDEANTFKLLEQLKGRPAKERSGRFITVLALSVEGILLQATGSLEGTIADSPSGENGFGYDSVFIPKGMTRTLAEMTNSEKNAVSHRAKALAELMAQVRSRGIIFVKA